MPNSAETYGYSCGPNSECHFRMIRVTYCEQQKTDFDLQLVEQIIMEEQAQSSLRMDKINSYTTTLGRKVRDTITTSFKEHW